MILMSERPVRRIAALLMAVITLFAFTSCEYKVKNEGKAEKVYTCPSDNMYGLEKIVVFEDGITMVFDKSICDKSKYAEFDEFETGDELFGKYFQMYGNHYYDIHISNSFLVKRGKYVASAFYYSDDVKAACEEEGFVLYGLEFDCFKYIEINDGNIILSYQDREHVADGYMLIQQHYYASLGEWGQVSEEIIGYPFEG